MTVILYFFNSLIKRGRKNFIIIHLVKVLSFLKIYFKQRKFFNLFLFRIIPVVGFLNKTWSGKLYKIPCFIKRKKAVALASRWFLLAIKKRSEKTFLLKLLGEIKDTVAGKSYTLQQKIEHHALAFENKQYLYLLRKRRRWPSVI